MVSSWFHHGFIMVSSWFHHGFIRVSVTIGLVFFSPLIYLFFTITNWLFFKVVHEYFYSFYLKCGPYIFQKGVVYSAKLFFTLKFIDFSLFNKLTHLFDRCVFKKRIVVTIPFLCKIGKFLSVEEIPHLTT